MLTLSPQEVTQLLADWGKGDRSALDKLSRSYTRSSGIEATPDWSPLFTESGLDQTKFQTVPSLWTPPHETTARAAWEGSYPDQPDFKIHIEAGAFEGKPVYFEIFDAWDQPRDVQASVSRFRERVLLVLLLAIFITVMLR